MFQEVTNYHTIHGAAHKRGAPPIGAPALTRHLVVTCDWADYDAEYGGGTNPDHPHHSKHDFNFLKWQERNLELTFVSLCENLGIHAETAPKRHDEEAMLNRHSAYQIFNIDSTIVKIVIDKFKDHLNIQINIDLEKGKSTYPGTVDKYESEAKFRSKTLNALKAISDDSTSREQLTQSVRFLREEIWQIIDDILCLDQIEGLPNSRHILDIRGCILQADGVIDDLPSSQQSHVKSAEPFSDAKQIDRGVEVLCRLLDVSGFLKNKEIVCCTLFRNSCIYMSPLGSHITPNNTTPSEPSPTFFGAITPQGSRWQTGRLIYRINQIATLRIMALKNLAEIQKAGSKMTELASKIEKLSDIDFKETTIQSKLVNLSKIKPEIDGLGLSGSSDLRYKVQRSRHFSNRFFKAVGTMDIGRIEGWQPYTEFIERRLRPSFDHVATVGERFDILVDAYHSQLSELDSELQRHNSHHLVHIQREILGSHSFQHKIESIALAYYGGSILFAAAFGAASYGKKALGWKYILFYFPINDDSLEIWEKSWKAAAFTFTSIFALIYYRFQEWKHKQKELDREDIEKEIMSGNYSKAGHEKRPTDFLTYMKHALGRLRHPFLKQGATEGSPSKQA